MNLSYKPSVSHQTPSPNIQHTFSVFPQPLFLRRTWSQGVAFAFVLIAGIWIAAGCAKKVMVPDVRNQDLDQAQKTLAAMRLKVSINGPQVAGAYVTEQSLTPGQQVDANSAVALTVEQPSTVPPLVGGNITDAVSALQGLGLRVAFLSKHTLNPFTKSKVEAQDPPPGTLVHRDTMVRLTVISPGGDAEALLNAVTNEPGYKNLNPKYKSFLNLFLAEPDKSRDMAPQDAPNAPNAPSTPNK